MLEGCRNLSEIAMLGVGLTMKKHEDASKATRAKQANCAFCVALRCDSVLSRIFL